MRVVIADDAVLLREGLARILADNGFEVVGQAGDADGLRLAVVREKPDLVIVDVRMPPTFTDEGTRAAIAIREEHPVIGIVVLSQVVEARSALKLYPKTRAEFMQLIRSPKPHFA